jgi:serine/threonine protein kinase
MAPEQLRGHPVPASDVWALGVVAYELVTGQRPFSPADIAMLNQAQTAPVTEPRTLSPALPKVAQAVILKALSYDPAHRYTHAHEMGQAFLRAVLEGDPPGPDRTLDPPPFGSESPAEPLRRCQELFTSFEEFRNPDSLRAFFSLTELETGRNCVSFSARLELDQLLDCLYRSGRNYRGQALVEVLSVLASHYRDDYRGKQCEWLRDSLRRLLERPPVAADK